MKIEGRIVVITGGGDGIGKALAVRSHEAGAARVVIADIDGGAAERVARSIGGVAFSCDVANEADIQRVVEETESRIGPIALFCSNAGMPGYRGGVTTAGSAPNDAWQRSWNVNVMAHVYAARALLPRMIQRGGGYFLNTISAAGLLNQIGSADYATTKHAAVGFAENLAITHRDQGIRVSILCPQGVDTALLRASPHAARFLASALTADQCAEAALVGIEAETFAILPHPEVGEYMKAKTENYGRWIAGMAKIQRSLRA